MPNSSQFRRLQTLLFQKLFGCITPLNAENVCFILKTLKFNLKSDDLAIQGFELVGLAFLSYSDSGRCLVNEVNGLIWKKPIRDITSTVNSGYDAKLTMWTFGK